METAAYMMAECGVRHPRTGDSCTKALDHVFSHDPQVKQHFASNGVKWPTLTELDPAEGFNMFGNPKL